MSLESNYPLEFILRDFPHLYNLRAVSGPLEFILRDFPHLYNLRAVSGPCFSRLFIILFDRRQPQI